MTQYFELTPAYGRDYPNAKEVTQAFNDGKDFIGDYQFGFSLVNIKQLPRPCVVMLRYKKERAVVPVKVG